MAGQLLPVSEPNQAFGDYDKRSFDTFLVIFQKPLDRGDFRGRALVPETEIDHATVGLFSFEKYTAKISIIRDKDSALRKGAFNHRAIRGAGINLANEYYIVAAATQPSYNAWPRTFVRQEAHLYGIHRFKFLCTRKRPGCIQKASLYVLWCKVIVFFKDFRCCRTMRQEVQDEFHAQARTGDHRFSAKDLGVAYYPR